MQTVTVHGSLQVDPDEHQVSDTRVIMQSYFKQGIKNLLVYSLSGAAASIVSYLVFQWTWEKDPEGLVGVLLSIIFFSSLALMLIALPYGLFCGLRSFASSCITPNLKTPASTLKAFLFSIRSDLPDRAWSLLTDQAKMQKEYSLPDAGILAKRIPRPEISDLVTFKEFWATFDLASWTPLFRKMTINQIDTQTAIVTCSFKIDHPEKANKKRYEFQAPFLLVKRTGLWFVATPFVWPAESAQ